MTNIISFPNAGLKFTINEIAFPLFGRGIYWYALILTTGMILAVIYTLWRAKQENISSDTVIDYAIFAIILGVIGARLYYVLTTLDQYNSFYDVIAVWNGGLGFYGSLIGGAVAVFAVARFKKMSVLKMYDIISPAMLIGQFVGRWGNFVNGEAYGSNSLYEFFGAKLNISGAESLPWAMQVDKVSDGKTVSSVLCQPTFLYESVWNVIGFVLINIFYKKKKFDGQVFFLYIAWYGLGRMFIEGLRTDSLYIGNIKISQLIGLACFVVGTVMFFVGSRFMKLHKYEPLPSKKTASDKAKAEATVETAEAVEETAETQTPEDKENKTEIKTETSTEKNEDGKDN